MSNESIVAVWFKICMILEHVARRQVLSSCERRVV